MEAAGGVAVSLDQGILLLPLSEAAYGKDVPFQGHLTCKMRI